MDHGILFIHECTLRHFKLLAVIFIVNTFNTDALLAHGSLVSGFIGSQYPIGCILMRFCRSFGILRLSGLRISGHGTRFYGLRVVVIPFLIVPGVRAHI